MRNGVVGRWRKAFGASGDVGTPGCRQAIAAAAQLGAETQRGREYTAKKRQARRETNLGQHLKPGYHGRRWTAEELAWPDDPALMTAEVARRVGRTWRAAWEAWRRLKKRG